MPGFFLHSYTALLTRAIQGAGVENDRSFIVLMYILLLDSISKEVWFFLLSKTWLASAVPSWFSNADPYRIILNNGRFLVFIMLKIGHFMAIIILKYGHEVLFISL